MKLKYTCFIYLLLISICSFSQLQSKKSTSPIPKKTTSASGKSSFRRQNTGSGNIGNTITQAAYSSPLTGVWRGFFTSGSGFFQEKYKYEVQIGQLSNNGLKGVTYSYRTTVFYGKANVAGMYTPSTKNVILKENKLIEVKMASGDACLMTCYLEYSKAGNTEILEGTFTSINTQTKSDCGSGRVYLEKVTESDFYKEDFVKDYETRKKTPAQRIIIQKTEKKDKIKQKDPPVIVKRNPVKKDDLAKKDPPAVPVPNAPVIIDGDKMKPIEEPKTPVAKELKERENTVAKVIHAEGDEIQIDLYDNGQIDDDTVTVYHNKQVVAWKKRLCHQPITIKIKVDPQHPRNEFVMVADNLGTIPPNTALMRITVGKQHFDVFLTSSFQKNAVVIIDCKIPTRESK